MPYVPKPIPAAETVEQLRMYIEEEFKNVQNGMAEEIALELRPVSRAPDKPRPGMLVYADGVTWNPGGGEGVYTYSLGGAWVKL